MRHILVTRHVGAIEWLQNQFSNVKDVELILHFTPQIIQGLRAGDRVYGTLPVSIVENLCTKGVLYYHLTLNIPENLRGAELSAPQMNEVGANLESYGVYKSYANSVGDIRTFADGVYRESYDYLQHKFSLIYKRGETLARFYFDPFNTFSPIKTCNLILRDETAYVSEYGYNFTRQGDEVLKGQLTLNLPLSWWDEMVEEMIKRDEARLREYSDNRRWR